MNTETPPPPLSNIEAVQILTDGRLLASLTPRQKDATMPSPKLKPCPFCGAEARLEIRGYDHKREYRVRCSAVHECGGSQYWFDHQREAVAAWNRRAKEGGRE